MRTRWAGALVLAAALALPLPLRGVHAQPVQDQPRPDRTRAVVVTAGLYGVLYGWTTLAWYLREDESPTFHWRNEGWFGADTYAGGADKLGHLWANYALTRGVTRILSDGGWPRAGSLLVSSLLSAGFFTMSEIHDGYHAGYGFSPNDMYANAIGITLGNLMESSPTIDRMFSLRLQYFPSPQFVENVANDGPFNSPEDYEGQTFLLSYHLATLPGLTRRPMFRALRYLDLSIGFEALGYLPRHRDPPEQHLFIGLSLNAQALWDDLRDPPTSMKALVTELYAPPLTVMRPWATDPFAQNTAGSP